MNGVSQVVMKSLDQKTFRKRCWFLEWHREKSQSF